MSDSKYLIFHGKCEEKLSEIIDQLKNEIKNLDVTDGDDSWNVDPYELIQRELEYTRNRHRYDYVNTSIGFYKEYWKKSVDWELPDDRFFESEMVRGV